MDSAHLVQFHKKSEYLSESVADFIRQGLAKGDGICVFATRYHWQFLKNSLMQEDACIEQHIADERLIYIDAQTVLGEISRHGRPEKEAFMDFIGDLIQRMQKTYPNLRIYGELVHLLCTEGKLNEAIDVEQYWNEILNNYPSVSRMCSFCMNSLSHHVHSITQLRSELSQVEHSSFLDDEDGLYRWIAILEQCSSMLKHTHGESQVVEDELFRIKKQLVEAGKISILGELCAGLAHELNNPLAIILSSVKCSRELMSRSNMPLTPVMRDIFKHLDNIDDASRRMTKIISNVLMFGRQHEHKFLCFSLNATLSRSIELMQDSLKIDHIQLELNLPQAELQTQGDAEMIAQVFLNIMANARDALASTHTREGRTLSISMERKHKQMIEIAFKDSGIGMDEQTLGKVFYPFFTTKAIGKGTGLGLSISHGIVTEHKGQIFCESTPGIGTLVRVQLPLAVESSAALRA